MRLILLPCSISHSICLSHRICSVDHQDALKSANKPRQRISPYLSKVVASVPEPVPMDIPAGDGTFKERCSKGAVQSVLNEDIPAKGATQAHAAGAIEVLGQPVEAHSRFMVDRLDDKAAYINHRISTFECEVENICGAGSAHPVGTAAQQPTFIVGRVCCDTEGEHLNAQSVILEGSVTVSHGARVPLDLSACPEFRLFPGQVAVVKGTNPSGFRIAASEVLTSLPLLVQQPMEDDSAQDGTSFIIAAGPYTATDNLAYEPLAALLEHCVEAQPDVLMLAGPFLDADHQILRDGALEHTFEEVFASRVVAQLTQFCDKVGGKTRVVLLPSPKDAHHEPVFPQGPMEFAAGSDITNLPNPCTFKYQGVVLGCSTVDWLMAAVREEIYQSAKQGERLPLLVMHQANQRR